MDLTKVDPKKSLEGNKNFQLSLDKTADMSFWMDYSKFMINSDMIPKEMRSLYDALAELTDEMILSGQGYFRAGEAEIKTSFSLNENMQRVMSAGYNKKGLNKKFFKYIDKTNLMGLYSGSVDLKGFMMAYGTEIHRVLKKQDTKETRIAINMMDIVDIFLDEEEIYSLFTGDFAFALTDMRVVNREVADFKYNEESNSWEEETETVEEVMPIMTMMMTYGNKTNLQHFIDLGVNMGGLIKTQEGVWTVPEFKKDLGMDLYIVLKDGLMMMTNDDQIAKNIDGLPATKQLPLASMTEMSNYIQYGMLDARQISRVAQKVYADKEDNMPNEIMELEKVFSRVEFKSDNYSGKDVKTNLYFRMRDQDANALQFLLDNIENLMSGVNKSSGSAPMEEYEEIDDSEDEEGVKRL